MFICLSYFSWCNASLLTEVHLVSALQTAHMIHTKNTIAFVITKWKFKQKLIKNFLNYYLPNYNKLLPCCLHYLNFLLKYMNSNAYYGQKLLQTSLTDSPELSHKWSLWASSIWCSSSLVKEESWFTENQTVHWWLGCLEKRRHTLILQVLQLIYRMTDFPFSLHLLLTTDVLLIFANDPRKNIRGQEIDDFVF